MPNHADMKEYLMEHPLADCVLRAFTHAARERSRCPYDTELTAIQVAQYLMGHGQSRELRPGEPVPDASLVGPLPHHEGAPLKYYLPIATDVMGVMVCVGYLKKVGSGLFRKGDTACVVSESVQLISIPEEVEAESSRGLSNDWLGVCEALDLVLFSEQGLFNKFSKNAVLAGLNYYLVSQAWKDMHQPEDMAHGFLKSSIYSGFCMHLEEQCEQIEPYEIFIPSLRK